MKLKHHALAIASMATLGMVTTAHAAKVGADFEVYGNLYPQIINFENILLASRQAQKGKRLLTDLVLVHIEL